MTGQVADTPLLKYRTKSFDRFLHSFPFSPFYEESNGLLESDSTSLDLLDSDAISLDLPEGWATSCTGHWTVINRPPGNPPLPHQGWKIHVSAIPGEAFTVLKLAADICFETRTSFKHLSSWTNYYRANMKYAPRSSSGKFITVYPDDDTVFLRLLERFEGALASFHGPYILSDVRYRSGPVFLRYGAFYLTPLPGAEGGGRYAVYTPSGELVEDVRAPSFNLPHFAVPPAEIADIVDQRRNPNPERLKKLLQPYTVQHSLHFSNGGGVYEARNSLTDERVVLKEARCWAGYSSAESSAVERLQNEYRHLQTLQRYPFVPRLHGLFTVDEHSFLAEEYVAGTDLHSWVATRFPFSLDPAEVEEYESNALAICQEIERIVDCVHQSGIALMDLQPKNLIIREDNTVLLIDLESACAVDGRDAQVPGTPGFVPEYRCLNRSRDLFALCNTAIYAFWPSTVTAFSADTLRPRLRRVQELYSPQTLGYLQSLVDRVDPDTFRSSHPFDQPLPLSMDSPALVSRIVDGIRQSSELIAKTNFRLYPGDSEQFSTPGGGINVETGALGIALILHRAGHDVAKDADWLKHALRTCPDMPTHGLLRGKLGVIAGLCEMGFAETAAEIAQSLVLDPLNPLDLSIRSGLAGSLIAALSCEVEAPGVLPESLIQCLVSRFDDALGASGPFRIVSPHSETGNAIGLFDGWSGVALAWTMLGRHLRDDAWGERAHRHAYRDLRHLKVNSSGAGHIRLSGVAYSYLSEGSAGVGYALGQIDRDHFSEEIKQICAGLQMGISLNPGLFRGLSGVSAALGAITGHAESARSKMNRQLEVVVDCYSFRHTASDALFFLGDNTYRLSADYSTGAAGVLAALLSKRDRRDLWLPYSMALSVENPKMEKGGES